MQFTKIKMTGFKSFVEPTEFIIAPGLTGVVGPNGCGKSNVVESLRWVMGENSAKKMRGGEMDDVIFSGSAGRPSRNLAEVTLYLDNSARTALAEFNHDDALEVTRRIERGMGSDYRINGKPVRQKDVHVLFADQATGAHSTSIVSQGRIAALIQAKPTERRQVLEEAAGISGLHARRHEAELKLKGAEGNLTRVDDQVQAMETQLRSLKTQVRQASRYRNLGALIRKAEAALLYLKAKQAEVTLRLTEDNFSESEVRVRDLTSAVTLATTARTEQAVLLPPLRQTETAAAAGLQRLHLDYVALEKELARVAGEQAALAQRLEEVAVDETREAALASDAAQALARLEGEAKDIAAKIQALAGSEPHLKDAVESAKHALDGQEQIVGAHTQSVAQAHAQHAALAQQSAAIAERETVYVRRQVDLQKQIEGIATKIAALPSLALAQSLVDACEADLARKQADAEKEQAAKAQAEMHLTTAREVHQKARDEKTKCDAEASALHSMLQRDAGTGTPLSDLVKVEPGYETALAAALGESLAAPLDDAAKMFWRDLPAYAQGADLPVGVQSLASYVDAPKALARALSQIGLIEDASQGDALAADLKPGQVLVARDGSAWRWDGYTQRAGAVTGAALRLQQRNRLAELEALMQLASTHTQKAEADLIAAQTALDGARRADHAGQQARLQAFAALNDARRHYADQAQAQAQTAAQQQSLADMMVTLTADLAGVEDEKKALAEKKQAMPDIEALGTALIHEKEKLQGLRDTLSAAQAAFASFARDKDNLYERQNFLSVEGQLWRERAQGAHARLTALEQRKIQLQHDAAALAEKPAQLAVQREELLSKKSAAEIARQEAADTLMAAEHTLNALEKDARQKEEALTGAKESRVRAEEQMYQARHVHEALVEKIKTEWHGTPEVLLGEAGVEAADGLPDPGQLEHDIQRYTRERDGMGPVNLRAEIEAEELQQAIDKMLAEKEDLTGAIATLRQAVATLNKEARARLQEAFEAVNKNFEGLFTRMFGGGKAHLQLIEHDDPLDAGLEIFACPPGKRLQALSLLSGGEQALTALSLLFALFLVKPSPICVLDEVDAPLDEANVDRYCTLLREMADAGQTRFIIITHHRLTMARMDRLYGVTMAEKGVSQLVSVDLKQALSLREQAGPAGRYAQEAAE